MEQNIVTMVDQKVQVFHKLLDGFELRVLAQQATITYLSFVPAEFDSLLANIDPIPSTPIDYPDCESTTLAGHIVLDALFSEDGKEKPKITRAKGQRH